VVFYDLPVVFDPAQSVADIPDARRPATPAKLLLSALVGACGCLTR